MRHIFFLSILLGEVYLSYLHPFIFLKFFSDSNFISYFTFLHFYPTFADFQFFILRRFNFSFCFCLLHHIFIRFINYIECHLFFCSDTAFWINLHVPFPLFLSLPVPTPFIFYHLCVSSPDPWWDRFQRPYFSPRTEETKIYQEESRIRQQTGRSKQTRYDEKIPSRECSTSVINFNLSMISSYPPPIFLISDCSTHSHPFLLLLSLPPYFPLLSFLTDFCKITKFHECNKKIKKIDPRRWWWRIICWVSNKK